VVGLTAFAFVERRAAEPVLPLWVLSRRVLNAANSAALLVGVLLVGLSTYVPLYAQSVLGTTALIAGFALAGMTLGWPIAASLAGRLYLRLGFRSTMVMGSLVTVAGTGVLLTVGQSSPVFQLGVACFVIGVGLGFTASPSVVAAQSSVGWQSRGVVTGATMFARSVGSAVGVAAFGALANAVVAARIGGDHRALESVPGNVLAPAVHDVFTGAAIAAVALVVAAACMPNRIEEAR
jgi:MFS family permease